VSVPLAQLAKQAKFYISKRGPFQWTTIFSPAD
jgi:hypothetical protein